MPECLVVQQHDYCPPGLLTAWAEAAGVTLDVRKPYAGEAVPSSAKRLSGVVVLGAPVEPQDDDEPPWRVPLKRLVTLAVARGVPLLALGGGAHLSAVALGGVTAIGTGPPRDGVWPLRLTAEGRSDLLLRHLPDDARWVQAGRTLFADLPVGSVVLADDGRGLVEAVRFGPRAWALHGHPEADTAMVACWLGVDDCTIAPGGGQAATEAIARFAAIEPDLAECWAPVLRAFFALVGGKPTAHGTPRA